MSTETPTAASIAASAVPEPRSLLARVQGMLLQPRQTWPVVAGEDDSIPRIYGSYLIWLLLIPTVAAFIGTSLIGVGAFGIRLRVPLLAGLVNLVVSYVLALVLAYAGALIASALAPRFGGTAHLPSAFKLVAYSATAALVGGVFQIIPMLGLLGLIAAVYSIYLLYLGVPVLMRVPQQRAWGYTAVLVICTIVLGVLVSLLSSLFVPGTAGLGGGIAARQAPKGVDVRIPGTDISVNTARMEEIARRLEQTEKSSARPPAKPAPEAAATKPAQDAISTKVQEAQQRLEQATQSGDTQAAAQSVQDMLGAVLGGGEAAQPPIAPEILRSFVPDQLGGMARTSIESQSNAAMGMQISSVAAGYEDAQTRQNLKLEVQNLGTSPMLVMGMAAWAASTLDKETSTQVDRIYTKDGVSYKESYRKDHSRSELTLLLPNKVLLTVRGNLPMDQLRAAVDQIEVRALGRVQGG